MPIQKTWSYFTEENVSNVPQVWGVYELGNRLRNEIYIGRSNNLRKRLMQHLNASGCISKAEYFRYDVTCSGERSCCYKERSLILKYKSQKGRLPECNDEIPDCTGK